METVLHQLENRLARRPADVADLMCVSRQSYYAMRKGSRAIPPYVAAHAMLLLRVPAEMVLELEREAKSVKEKNKRG